MFYFSGGEILDSDAVTSFLYELYSRREYIPKEINPAQILSPEDAEALSSWLSEKAGHRIYVRTPFKGETRRLCDMAGENAEIRAAEYAKADKKEIEITVSLFGGKEGERL
jgi:excinuclease ABC subunit C